MMTAQQADFGQTPSQTVGPFFAFGLTAHQYGYDFGQPFGAVLAGPRAAGEHIRLEGRVLDGDGVPIGDALVEICQVDGEGRYPANAEAARMLGFTGFGRMGTGTGTEPDHRFVFDTVKPAPQAPGEAPHIDLILTMRGLLLHVFTRIYFADEAEANAGDAVLRAVPEARRRTLLTGREIAGGRVVYRFDIHMQGDDETVFFDV